MNADQGLCFLAGGLIDRGARIFAIGQDFGGELELVRFSLWSCLDERFGEEQVCAVERAVVLIVKRFQHIFVLRRGGGFNERGCDGAVGKNAEESCEWEFLLEVEEDEEDEVGVSAFESFVECDFVFFHRKE